MKRTIIIAMALFVAGCASYQEPPARIAIKDYVKWDYTKVCSATDGKRTVVWSCK